MPEPNFWYGTRRRWGISPSPEDGYYYSKKLSIVNIILGWYNLIMPIPTLDWFQSLPHSITALYKGVLENPHTSTIDKTLYELLITNFTIWGYEDNARRKDVPDKDIANLKRNIDRENQKRHDLIDLVDALLKEDVEKKVKITDTSLPLNSETPGSTFDRLTVLALRTHSLEKEISRKGADKKHIER